MAKSRTIKVVLVPRVMLVTILSRFPKLLVFFFFLLWRLTVPSTMSLSRLQKLEEFGVERLLRLLLLEGVANPALAGSLGLVGLDFLNLPWPSRDCLHGLCCFLAGMVAAMLFLTAADGWFVNAMDIIAAFLARLCGGEGASVDTRLLLDRVDGDETCCFPARPGVALLRRGDMVRVVSSNDSGGGVMEKEYYQKDLWLQMTKSVSAKFAATVQMAKKTMKTPTLKLLD